MKIISNELTECENRFVVQLDSTRQVYLVIKKDDPTTISFSSAISSTCNSPSDTRSAIDEASVWILEEVHRNKYLLK